MEPFEIFVEINQQNQTYLVFDSLQNESFEVFDGDVRLGNFVSIPDDNYGIRWETDALMPVQLVEKIGDAIERHFM